MSKIGQYIIEHPELIDDQELMRMNTEPSIDDQIVVLVAAIKSNLASALEDFEFFNDPNGGTLDKIEELGCIIIENSKSLRMSKELMKLLKQKKDEEEEAEIEQELIDEEEYENDMSHQAGLERERLYLF